MGSVSSTAGAATAPVATCAEIDVENSSSTTSSMKYGDSSHQLTIANGTTSTITRTTGGTRSQSMATNAPAARAVPPKVKSSVREFSNGASRMSGSMATSTSSTTAIRAATRISNRVMRSSMRRPSDMGEGSASRPVAGGVSVWVTGRKPPESVIQSHPKITRCETAGACSGDQRLGSGGPVARCGDPAKDRPRPADERVPAARPPGGAGDRCEAAWAIGGSRPVRPIGTSRLFGFLARLRADAVSAVVAGVGIVVGVRVVRMGTMAALRDRDTGDTVGRGRSRPGTARRCPGRGRTREPGPRRCRADVRGRASTSGRVAP